MKVLIYADKNKLKPIGGPYGYLYNLNLGLQQIKNTSVHFLNENSDIRIKDDNSRLKKIKNKVWLPYFVLKSIFNSGKESKVNFKQYDIIHFNSTIDLYNNRKLLKNYTGKIVLTSHSPEAPYKEIYSMLKDANFCFSKQIARFFEKADIYAFTHASYIIFPCKEAMAPYLHTWAYFRENYSVILSKSKFLITGLARPKNIKPASLNFIKNRKKKFLVCYIGRHNKIKGYDLLLKAAKKIEKVDKSIEFIVAGKEMPLKHDKSLKNWHELGWINNPLEISKACDLFVLPNRETYFDLALIEALATPADVLISNTGGNDYFKKYNTDSINFFKSTNVEDLVRKILAIKHVGVTSEIKNKNLEIYNKDFKTETFAKAYINIMKEIEKN